MEKSTIIIGIIASTGIWTVVNTIIQKIWEYKSAKTELLIGIAHDRICFLCKKHISEGSISHGDYDDINYLYKPYKKLGGNGGAEKLMKEVEKLPISEE